ncbi:hypothetical protein TrRE_jg3292, partial [Triparma retinervis]
CMGGSRPERSLSSRLAEATFRGSIWGGLWAMLFGKVEMMDFYTSRSATVLEFVNLKEYARNIGTRLSYVPRGAVNGAAFFSIWYTIGHIGCNVIRIREETVQFTLLHCLSFVALGGGLRMFHHENPYVSDPLAPGKGGGKKYSTPTVATASANKPSFRRFSTSSLRFILSRGRIK